MAGVDRLYAHMVSQARFRDRLYMGSDATAARELGVSRRTIIRWRQDLEKSGRIIRCGWKRWAVGKRTVIYRFANCAERYRSRPVTQRTSFQKLSLSSLGTYRLERTNVRERTSHKTRRCGQMSGNDLVPHKGGDETPAQRLAANLYPHNAGGVLGMVVDTFAIKGLPVDSRARGIIGKQAKQLLIDGYDFEVVCIGAIHAYKRSRPDLMTSLTRDLLLTRAGEHTSAKEWARMLEDEKELGGR